MPSQYNTDRLLPYLALQNVSLAFFVTFDLACKQQLIRNVQILMYFMCFDYMQLCHCPVIIFLCHFLCSPSQLLFHLHILFIYKVPISFAKQGVFLGQNRA